MPEHCPTSLPVDSVSSADQWCYRSVPPVKENINENGEVS